jgi:hypothetical protein
VRQVLFRRWDPIDVAGDFPVAADEYDGYARECVQRMERGAHAAEIESYLRRVQVERMGRAEPARGRVGLDLVAAQVLACHAADAPSTFVVGQYVELYPTVPSEDGGSVESGTRAVVEVVEGDVCTVALLANERLTGQRVRVPAHDLFPA